MAWPTPVNSQITDAVSQASLMTLGNAPAMAMSSVYQSMAHSTSILYQNAVMQQQQSAICAQAATNQGIMQLYSVTPMGTAAATSRVARSNDSDMLLTLLLALAVMKK